MKRRVLSLVLALCLVAGMLPSVTLAATAASAGQSAAKTITVTLRSSITWEAKPNECYYATTSVSGEVTDLGKLDKEPARWNIKLDNTGSVAKLTLKGAVIWPNKASDDKTQQKAIEASGEGALEIIVDGASYLHTKFDKVLTLNMAGGTTITSLNNSKLSVITESTAMYCPIEVIAGSLALLDANLYLSAACRNTNNTISAISAAGQDVTISGGTLTVNAYNKSTNAITAKNLTIKDYAKVTLTHSVPNTSYHNSDSYANIPEDLFPYKRHYGVRATGNIVLNNASLTIIDKDVGENKGSWIYAINKLPAGLANVKAQYSETDDGANLQDLIVSDTSAEIEYPYIAFTFICDGHKYDNATDADCNKCGETREVSKIEQEIEPEPEKTPFYLANWMGAVDEELPEYIASMPRPELLSVQDGKVTIRLYGITDIPTMAQMLKNVFDSMPEGTRYLNFPLSIQVNVEHMIYMDKTVAMFKAWIEEFFTEYKRIGGKIDGLTLDTEYSSIGAHYIHAAYNTKEVHEKEDEEEGTFETIRPNINIYNNIVNDSRYATEVRPYLVEKGFKFGTPRGYESEIYPMHDKSSAEYDIWNSVMHDRMCRYLNEACAPFMELFPYADVSNYKYSGGNMWNEGTAERGGTVAGGNTMYAGNTANANFYLRRPHADMRDTSAEYKTPITYNQAVYEEIPFNAFLMETSAFKDMYAASDNKRISTWITGFNYGTASRPEYGLNYSPYYAETLLHIGLLDPQPFLGYIIGPRDTDNEGDGYTYDDVMKNVSDILKELNRLVGYVDRKPIEIQRNWNSNFVLSGMYAAGRNVWRITPNTCQGTSLEDFKVKDQVPTFTIDGETIIFPQGRIIADGDVHVTGTCGYWVETPKDVMPVIITDADRYEKYPAYQENFDTYDAGTTFSATTAQHENAWTVSGDGTATVTSRNGSNALALSGTTTITNTKIPKNVTAGDSYAKQQLWEVTVTIPTSGELCVLSCGGYDSGVVIYGGKISGGGTQFASVKAGNTYIISREIDFGKSTCTYTVRNTDGTLVGQKANVAMAQVTLPVANITFSTIAASGAYIDNYRLQAIGVTTELRLYEADTGMRISDATATTTEDAVYRLSWHNASGEYQIAKIYNNGKLIQTIEMPSGADSYTTGHITSGSKITVTVEKGTAPTHPEYDDGDFDWKAHPVYHTNTYDVEGTAPTCTETGTTSSRYCYDCEAWVIKQEIVPATGHTYDNAGDPDCNVCGEIREVPKNITMTLNGGSIAWNVAPGEIYYATTTTSGAVTDLGKVDAEPKNWQIKLDNTKPVAELTLRDATIKAQTKLSGEGALKINVVSDSSVTGKPAGGGQGVLDLDMKGGIIITGAGRLQIIQNETANYFALRIASGDLTLDHANLLASTTKHSQLYAYFTVAVQKGSLYIKGGSLQVTVGAGTGSGIKVFNELKIFDGAEVTVTKNSLGKASMKDNMNGISAGVLSFNGGKLVVSDAAGFVFDESQTYRSRSLAAGQINRGYKVEIKLGNSEADASIFKGNIADVTNLAEYRYISFEYVPGGIADCTHAYASKQTTCEEEVICHDCDQVVHEAKAHDYVTHDAKAPTCTEIGWEAYQTCNDCEYTTYSEIAAIGHSLENHDAKAPTCTEIGWEAYQTCNNCDYTTYKEIAAKGHSYVDHAGREATCTEIGWEAYQTCKNCTYTTYSELAATGHKYTSEKTDATCTVDGKIVYTCACGDTYEEGIEATGHTAGADATCTEDQICTVCGDVLTEKLGHTAGKWHEVLAPTCTETGLKERTCSVCGQNKETETIAATGHSLDNHDAKAPTCTEIGWEAYQTCNNCDYTTYKEIAAKGHAAGTVVVENEVAATCNTDGSYDNVIYCTVCDAELSRETITVKAKGHTAGTPVTENEKAATCGADGSYDTVVYCSICNAELSRETTTVPATGAHVYVDVVESKDATCTEDGYVVKECTCGATETTVVSAKGHSLENHDGKAATCTEIGWEAYQTCNNCDYTTYKEIAAKGHTAGTVVVENEVAATCGADGSYDTVVYCSVCNAELSRETITVDALGHTFADGYCACGEKNPNANFVAKVFDKNGNLLKEYTTLVEAVANAKDGQTVELQKKQTGAALVISTDITINFGGNAYTVNADANGAAIVIDRDAVVTLKNGTIQPLYAERALFTNLIINNGTLTTANITLVGKNLPTSGATIVNNGTLALNAGTVVNARKTALVATANVTKDASVELEAPEGYYWVDDTTLKEPEHVHDYTFKTDVVEVNFDRSGYIRHTCACGDSYIDSVISRLVAYAQNIDTGTKYQTLAEAVANAKDGETVKLLKKQSGAAMTINTDVKIDLAGLAYTVNTANKNGSAVTVAKGANVTLENGKIQISASAKTLFDYLVVNKGDLTTKSITLRGDNLLLAAVTIQNNGTLDLQVGTVVSTNNIAMTSTTVNVTKDASVELEAPEGYYWVDDTTLKEPEHVHDYTFKTDVVEVNFDRSGYIRHTCACGDSYIDSVISRLVAYAQNIDTGTKYQTLAEAVANAKDGETVKLLKNQTGAALEINADITVDFNGFTYTVKEDVNGAAIVVAENVEAKITNGTVQIAYSSRLDFNCLVNNLGALEATNITLKAANAYAADAVAIKGNAVTGNAAIIAP